MHCRILLVLFLMLANGLVFAEEPTARSSEPDYDSFVLLSPDTPASDRSQQLQKLQARAENRGPRALYLLGTLYRLGDAHPSKVLPRDLDKARNYLSNAAILGLVNPMAGMAELELEANRPLDALTWTYIYLHYQRGKGAVKPEKLPLEYRGITDGYDANLLERVMDSATEAGVDPAAAGRYADAFIAKYDVSIRESLAKAAAKDDRDMDVILMTSNAAYSSANLRARTNVIASSTTAVFLFRFGDSGKPEAMVVEDILPGHRDVSIDPLATMARRRRIQPLAPGRRPKFLPIPVPPLPPRARIEEKASAP